MAAAGNSGKTRKRKRGIIHSRLGQGIVMSATPCPFLAIANALQFGKWKRAGPPRSPPYSHSSSLRFSTTEQSRWSTMWLTNTRPWPSYPVA